MEFWKQLCMEHGISCSKYKTISDSGVALGDRGRGAFPTDSFHKPDQSFHL
jgi:hypothetical protein